MKKIKNITGSITPALLVLTGAFVVVIYGLLLLLATQLDFSNRQVLSEQSLSIAEAGVNYYRWHLAHAPDDFQDGTGEAGPYIHDYADPEGNVIGEYSLEIIPPENGSSIVTIRSTGYTDVNPSIKRTIEAQYGQPSLARYSFLQHAASWYGDGITVNGDVHSNTGIRMDGINTARVSSAQEEYVCGSETGCSPSTMMPGVWGSGGDQGLWEYPVPTVPFSTIEFNFDDMQQSADQEGLNLGESNAQGFHLVFNENGTVDVRRVTWVGYYNGYDSDDGCRRRYQRIFSETSIGTYDVADTPIIFAEDHVWIEGVVNGRVTVVAARFPIASNEMNIWIEDNITYASYDGSNSLGLIAQHDIYFSRNIPEDFQIDAALMAQGGKIIRHGYFWWCGGSSQAIKDQLTINGAVISFEKSYWNFGSGPTSGFINREINYDGNLLFMPPPYFPVSGEYEFISWKEL